MKAQVYRRYGGPEVVELHEVPTPEPKADEILVKIHATTVSAADWRARTLEMPRGFGALGRLAFGVARPRQPILGGEFAGVVAAIGPGVSRFAVGDEVFGATDARFGCHAQFQTIRQDRHVARKPGSVPVDEAAALSFGGVTALHYLDKAALAPGERVLVVGAAGCVGSAAVQLAKHAGAEVTAVASADNLDLVRAIGADHVLDRAREDPYAGDATYDVVVDTVGAAPLAHAKRALREGGRLLAVAADLPGLLAAPLPLSRGRRVVAGVALGSREKAERLAQLASTGAFRPVIDGRYAFEDIREAHARVASRHKRGSVVVLVPHEA